MSNQTIASVPADLDDLISNKRFLLELVENLDVVIGYKGGEEDFLTTGDLAGVSLAQLTQIVQTLREQVSSNTTTLEELNETVEELLNTVDGLGNLTKTESLGNVYYDFDEGAYSQLRGYYEFTALGSDLVNPPAAVIGGNTYTVYIDSIATNLDVRQEVILYDTDANTIAKYLRVEVGGSWQTLS